MAEAQTYMFSYKEIVEALIKQQGIHEGLWGISMRFGISGANMPGQNPATEPLMPVAIVPVLEVGLQKVTEEMKHLPGICDAAVVNPKKSSSAS